MAGHLPNLLLRPSTNFVISAAGKVPPRRAAMPVRSGGATRSARDAGPLPFASFPWQELQYCWNRSSPAFTRLGLGGDSEQAVATGKSDSEKAATAKPIRVLALTKRARKILEVIMEYCCFECLPPRLNSESTRNGALNGLLTTFPEEWLRQELYPKRLPDRIFCF